VTLIARVEDARREIVSFGVPAPPELLSDSAQVRLEDEAGRAIQASVTPLEWWPSPARNSLRSVLVQFVSDFGGRPARRVQVRFNRGAGPLASRMAAVADTLLSDDGLKGPRVLALLPASWMCGSLVAGPQVPAASSGAYAAYDALADRSFPGSLNFIDSQVFKEWLFDRTTCWYKMYVRTGSRKYAEAAYQAAHFVRQHTSATGAFTLKGFEDPKYVYPQAMHLHYLLTGDDRALEAGKAMARLHLRTLDPVYDPSALRAPPLGVDPERDRRFWSPRQQGLGLLGVVHGWEMTGEVGYLDKARGCVDVYARHQASPPDGAPPDGSWRQDWWLYDPNEAPFKRATSAWMTAILLDALFQYWVRTRDARVAPMVTKWCDFLDREGFVPDGSQAWYVIDCLAGDAGHPTGTPGVDMYAHNLELAYSFAMGVFFSSDPRRREVYGKRFADLFRRALTIDLNAIGRSYNWAFVASSQLVYFMQRPGAGASIEP